MLTEPRCAPHGPQPPFGRLRHHCRNGKRFPRRQRVPAEERCIDRRSAETDRLLHLLRRQVAPDADVGADRRRPLRPLANRARFRTLPWLPTRRGRPVASNAHRRQPSRRDSDSRQEKPRRIDERLPRQRRHRRRVNPDVARPATGVVWSSVLPLSPFRRSALPLPRPARIHRPLCGPLRRWVGCPSTGHVRAPAGDGHHPRGDRPSAAQQRSTGMGLPRWRRAAPLRPLTRDVLWLR